MANADHIEVLFQGTTAWNKWRASNPNIVPDLSGSLIFDNVDLSGANLSHADLRETNLNQADLANADLSGAILIDANLDEADLVGTNLENADLTNADLMQTDLARASLELANLSGARLIGANLEGANLGGANLSGANLSDALGVELNECRVLHTIFGPRAKDQWSELRRTYTGPKLVFNLIFVVMFFVPLAFKGTAFLGVSYIQKNWSETSTHEVNAPHQSLNQLISISEKCEGATGEITIRVTPETVNRNRINLNLPAFEKKIPCKKISVLKLILGFDSKFSFMPFLTIILIFYQGMRFVMTDQISLIRDEEDRSRVSPSKKGRLAYPKLYRIHRILKWIFWISILAFSFRIIEFMQDTIILPRAIG